MTINHSTVTTQTTDAQLRLQRPLNSQTGTPTPAANPNPYHPGTKAPPPEPHLILDNNGTSHDAESATRADEAGPPPKCSALEQDEENKRETWNLDVTTRTRVALAAAAAAAAAAAGNVQPAEEVPRSQRWVEDTEAVGRGMDAVDVCRGYRINEGRTERRRKEGWRRPRELVGQRRYARGAAAAGRGCDNAAIVRAHDRGFYENAIRGFTDTASGARKGEGDAFVQKPKPKQCDFDRVGGITAEQANGPLNSATAEETVSATLGEASASNQKSAALRTRNAMLSLLLLHQRQGQPQPQHQHPDDGDRRQRQQQLCHYGSTIPRSTEGGRYKPERGGNTAPENRLTDAERQQMEIGHPGGKTGLTRLPSVKLIPPHLAQFAGSRPERLYAWLYPGASSTCAGADGLGRTSDRVYDTEAEKNTAERQDRSVAGGPHGTLVEIGGAEKKESPVYAEKRGHIKDFNAFDTVLWCSVSVIYLALRWIVEMCMPLGEGLYRTIQSFLRGDGDPEHHGYPRSGEYRTARIGQKQRPRESRDHRAVEVDMLKRRRRVYVACGLFALLVLLKGPGGALKFVLKVVVLTPGRILLGFVRWIVVS